jgi:hypothetical protein
MDRNRAGSANRWHRRRIAALFAGLTAIHMIGGKLESFANVLLMTFGTIYLIWGLRRSFRRDPLAVIHPHTHQHSHGHHITTTASPSGRSSSSSPADPCVAVIPMILAAAGAGWLAVAAVIVAYELATIVTMVGLVTAAHSGIRALRAPWLDRYGDAAAGALIVCVGAAMAVLGI